MSMLVRAVKQSPGVIAFGGGWPGVAESFLTRHGWQNSESMTGVSVTHDRAMRLPAYSTAVKVIAEDVGRTPIITYRRTDAGKERAQDHPTYPVLHDAPNPYMTASTFKKTLQAHCLGWGNGYASIVANGNGIVTGLWPLRPDMMGEPYIDDAGRLKYPYTLPSGETRILDRREVFHLPGLSFDGIKGYPVLSAFMREALGVALAQQEFVARFYANDASPGVYLKTPNKLSDAARTNLRGSFEGNHVGLTNAHRLAILEEGLDIGQIGISPVEQQLLEARKWSATEIAGAFRLAPWKVGVYDRATWANVEDGNIDHLSSALMAWFVAWDQQINLQVYGVGSEYFAEHLVTAWLRGNSQARAAYYTVMRAVSGMSADEIREAENLNRRGGAADDLFAPLNTAPIDSLLKQPTEPGAAAAPDPTGDLVGRINALGILVRSGAEPNAARDALGLPDIPFLPVRPVTVTPTDVPEPPVTGALP